MSQNSEKVFLFIFLDSCYLIALGIQFQKKNISLISLLSTGNSSIPITSPRGMSKEYLPLKCGLCLVSFYLISKP